MSKKDLTEELLEELEAMHAPRCSACGTGLCAHEFVINVALGFKNKPECVDCHVARSSKSRGSFLEHVLDYLLHKDCYREGWSWAAASEQSEDPLRPGCLWPPAEATSSMSAANGGAGASDRSPAPRHDTEWDAKDLACGDLALDLRIRMQGLRPGQVLLLRALDPGGEQDIPAWCRLTGHTLRAAAPPQYWIERRSDPNE